MACTPQSWQRLARTTPLATYVYSYDNANRVTSETDAEGTATFTYDNANELTGVDAARGPSRTATTSTATAPAPATARPA